MKFYNREKEIAQLTHIRESAKRQAQMTVLIGRRRVGKTQLLLESSKNEDSLYFFVARKSEVLLCQDFIREVERKLSVPILGEVKSFAQLFEYLMQLSQQRHFTLIIDEFQDFSQIKFNFLWFGLYFDETYFSRSKRTTFWQSLTYFAHQTF